MLLEIDDFVENKIIEEQIAKLREQMQCNSLPVEEQENIEQELDFWLKKRAELKNKPIKIRCFMPESMQNLKRWVLYVREGNKKMPYSAHYEGYASSTNEKTWATYEKACRVLEQREGASGVSFALSEQDNIVCIDLDHCIDDGEPNELARNILEQFRDTFVELSCSGNGIHIFCKGTLPAACKTKEIEIYTCKRFIATTGRAIYCNELADKQEQLDKLYKFATRHRKQQSTERVKAIPLDMTEQEIIDKACSSRNGSKFEDMLRGNWQGYGIGDGSQSSADLSFANSLSFWCGGNYSMAEHIFRNSGMYRNEYKMRRALDKAFNSCSEVFRGARVGGV